MYIAFGSNKALPFWENTLDEGRKADGCVAADQAVTYSEFDYQTGSLDQALVNIDLTADTGRIFARNLKKYRTDKPKDFNENDFFRADIINLYRAVAEPGSNHFTIPVKPEHLPIFVQSFGIDQNTCSKYPGQQYYKVDLDFQNGTPSGPEIEALNKYLTAIEALPEIGTAATPAGIAKKLGPDLANLYVFAKQYKKQAPTPAPVNPAVPVTTPLPATPVKPVAKPTKITAANVWAENGPRYLLSRWAEPYMVSAGIKRLMTFRDSDGKEQDFLFNNLVSGDLTTSFLDDDGRITEDTLLNLAAGASFGNNLNAARLSMAAIDTAALHAKLTAMHRHFAENATVITLDNWSNADYHVEIFVEVDSSEERGLVDFIITKDGKESVFTIKTNSNREALLVMHPAPEDQPNPTTDFGIDANNLYSTMPNENGACSLWDTFLNKLALDNRPLFDKFQTVFGDKTW